MSEKATVLVALGMLRTHYPGEHPAIEEMTVHQWHACGLGALPDDALLITAEEWDTTAHRRFPSSGEFLLEAQGTARRLMTQVPEPDEWAMPVMAEIVAGFPLPTVTATDRAFVEGIRAGLGALRLGFSYFDALNAVLADAGLPVVQPESAADVLGAEEPFDFRPRRADGTVHCQECTDSGQVRRRAHGVEMLRPCSACRPIAHRRWARGHFLPGHDCEECRMIRKGKPPAWVQELRADGFDLRPAV